MMDTYNATAPRNSISAGKGVNSMVNVSKTSKSIGTNEGKNPISTGSGIQGFGGSGKSGITASNSGKAPTGAGSSVAGFSGNGVKGGKI